MQAKGSLVAGTMTHSVRLFYDSSLPEQQCRLTIPVDSTTSYSAGGIVCLSLRYATPEETESIARVVLEILSCSSNHSEGDGYLHLANAPLDEVIVSLPTWIDDVLNGGPLTAELHCVPVVGENCPNLPITTATVSLHGILLEDIVDYAPKLRMICEGMLIKMGSGVGKVCRVEGGNPIEIETEHPTELSWFLADSQTSWSSADTCASAASSLPSSPMDSRSSTPGTVCQPALEDVWKSLELRENKCIILLCGSSHVDKRAIWRNSIPEGLRRQVWENPPLPLSGSMPNPAITHIFVDTTVYCDAVSMAQLQGLITQTGCHCWCAVRGPKTLGHSLPLPLSLSLSHVLSISMVNDSDHLHATLAVSDPYSLFPTLADPHWLQAPPASSTWPADLHQASRQLRHVWWPKLDHHPLNQSTSTIQLPSVGKTGLLLVGPPGCGKSLFLTQVLLHCGWTLGIPLFHLSPARVFRPYLGESEAMVRRIVRNACQQPSLLYLTGLEALAPRRDSTSSSQVAHTVLATLLNELDGIEERQMGLVIVAECHDPSLIDPALLRPGRLDRQVSIGSWIFPRDLQLRQNMWEWLSHDICSHLSPQQAAEVAATPLPLHATVASDLVAALQKAVASLYQIDLS
jgi:hypothetical protein